MSHERPLRAMIGDRLLRADALDDDLATMIWHVASSGTRRQGKPIRWCGGRMDWARILAYVTGSVSASARDTSSPIMASARKKRGLLAAEVNSAAVATAVPSENSIRLGSRVVRQNHRMIAVDGRNPARARDVHRRLIQAAWPACSRKPVPSSSTQHGFEARAAASSIARQ